MFLELAVTGIIPRGGENHHPLLPSLPLCHQVSRPPRRRFTVGTSGGSSATWLVSLALLPGACSLGLQPPPAPPGENIPDQHPLPVISKGPELLTEQHCSQTWGPYSNPGVCAGPKDAAARGVPPPPVPPSAGMWHGAVTVMQDGFR